MTTISLNNFTVPLHDSNTGTLMPKLSYRFRVFFTGLGYNSKVDDVSLQVTDASRPVVTFDQVAIPTYNSTINLVSKPKWSALAITVRDDVNSTASRVIADQLQKQFNFNEQSSAASGGDYKFTTIIEMLDGGNGVNEATVLETWTCAGCILTMATYSALKYSDTSAFSTIALSIQPDICVLENSKVDPLIGNNPVIQNRSSNQATNI